MNICEVTIDGYRNFKHAKVCFEQSTLIIGANDIGKSNLLQALRILLDKGLSLVDIEPKDTDFYVYEDTPDITITIKLINCTEDCVISRLKGRISDQGELYLQYQAHRDASGKKTYKLLIGHSLDALEEIEDRYYLRSINLKYISSNRELSAYIRRERRNILEEARASRDEEQISSDNIVLDSITSLRAGISEKVNTLTYVSASTSDINEELKKLSFHNESQNVLFDTGASDTTDFVNDLELVSQVNGKKTLIGGDGRNNQIFLAMWAARNGMRATQEDPPEVTIYCIEEPESHLHPHQQRKLAQYLSENTNNQVFITSHSPHIAAEFSPNSIIRLCNKGAGTVAASDGCGPRIEESFIQFGHRLNVIPAEAFFSQLVFLVEGASEELFYKALAKALKIDLDRLNVSILMVDGIGFATYITVLKALEIDYLVRTDNDVFKIPQSSNEFRLAGINRAIEIYNSHTDERDIKLDELIQNKKQLLKWEGDNTVPESVKQLSQDFKALLETNKIFISEKDLENDLLNSPMSEYLQEFYKTNEGTEIIDLMQARKATFMYQFLREYSDKLECLKEHSLAAPLLLIESLITH